MPQRILLEDSDHILLEDGTGFALLEEDWATNQGSGGNSWSQASDAGPSGWTPVNGSTGNSWAPASDANTPTWTPVPGSGGQSWDNEGGS